MLSLSPSCRYFLYCLQADMRKGFDGLSGLVRNELHQNPLSGDVFIFINKRRNQIKLLLWEGDGFSLYYKRLERGTYELPTVANKGGSLALRNDELTLILQGISLRSVQRRKRYKIIDKNMITEQAAVCV